MFKEVKITSDKTPKQRLFFQNLRNELNSRHSNGESNQQLNISRAFQQLSLLRFKKTHKFR